MRRKDKSAAALALLTLLCLTAACGRSSASVVVAGSTSVQPYAEILAEEFAAVQPGSQVDVQGGGSAAGITAAESGIADIGMSSRDLTDDENSQLWSVEIAKDGIALVVNPANPVSGLTLDQVRDIYDQAVTSWSQAGGRNAPIDVITREDGSGTRSSFESMVMGGEQITPRAIVQDSNGAVRQVVADDPNAIGFISLGLVDDTVKSVTLDGVEPTDANVVNGTYSLYRPFLFLAKTEPTGEAKQFVDFVLSPAGQQVLVKEGLIPAND